MGFLRKLFSRGEPVYEDKGIYLYFRSNRAADAVTKIRIEPSYELNSTGSGYVWHKTIVDSRYFSRLQVTIHFDNSYNVTQATIDNGDLISAEEFEAIMAERNKPAAPAADSDAEVEA